MLILIFVLFPVAYLMMPDTKKSGIAADPEALARMLEQQQKVIEDLRATPVPTEAFDPAAAMASKKLWQLRHADDKEEIDISFAPYQSGFGTGSFALRGRKFAALAQHDPKVPDQPLLFVREITAKDFVPDGSPTHLRADGEALVTSGMVPYRVGLIVTVTAELTNETAKIVVEAEGRKNGRPANQNQAIEQIGLGEFRIGYKRSFMLSLKSPSEPTPVPTVEAPAPMKQIGSYQRLPMPVPESIATPAGKSGRR